MEIRNIIRSIYLNPRNFFLENLGVRQTIFKNTFWLAVAEGIGRFLKLILIIYVARILGATEYGKFTFALAFVGLFAIFSDLGISSICTREIAREKEKEKEFPAVLSLKLLLSIGTLILICLGSFFITLDPIIRGMIWILGIYIIVSSFSQVIYAFFQARQKMEYEAWAKILQAAAVTGAGFFVLFNFPSVQNLSLSYLFASLIALLFILFFFHFKVYRLKIYFNSIIWRNILAMSWPLALSGMMGSICADTDSIMMGYWGQIIQTGWYNAAQRIMVVALIPTGLIGASFFPVLSKFFGQSKEKLQKGWNYFMEVMIFIAVPLVIGGIVLASKIIDFVYDPTFFPSILVFQILIVTGGIAIITGPFIHALIVSNQQKKTFWIVLFGALTNVILNFILIPEYSLYGAAFTTLVASFLMLFLSFKSTLKFTEIKPINLKLVLTFFAVALSTIPMCFVITRPQIYNLYIIWIILIGAVIYTISLVILKGLISYFSLFSKISRR
ncbi:MAG: flippase [Candidatus Nealsonbacteria bacterium]|nr:flippase [Candidatus Nealsonbacteria bacterium]